jgi:flavin-binding protein dodecin
MPDANRVADASPDPRQAGLISSKSTRRLEEVDMSISRTTEIKSASQLSFDDAMKRGIARALKTLQNVRGAWIENQEVILDGKGQIAEYRVQMKITFILEE